MFWCWKNFKTCVWWWYDFTVQLWCFMVSQLACYVLRSWSFRFLYWKFCSRLAMFRSLLSGMLYRYYQLLCLWASSFWSVVSIATFFKSCIVRDRLRKSELGPLVKWRLISCMLSYVCAGNHGCVPSAWRCCCTSEFLKSMLKIGAENFRSHCVAKHLCCREHERTLWVTWSEMKWNCSLSE